MGWREAEREFTDELVGRTTLPRLFAESSERYRDGTAQLYKGGIHERSLTPDVLAAAPDGDWASISYEEMSDLVRTLAAGFRDLGIGPGDRVGIFAHTRMEWALCDFALLGAGAVVTTVYPGSSPARVEFLLGDAGASAVVVENADLLDRVHSVEDDLDLSFVVSMDEVPDASTERDDVYTLEDVHARGVERGTDDYDAWLDEREPDDLASLIYTSGTTGRPKGVELTHWNFKANVDQCRRRFGPRPDKEAAGIPTIGPDSRVVSFLPLAHVFERLAGHFFMFAGGATVAYAESPDTLREDFAAVRPTSGTSVPRVYEKIYDAIREQASESAIKKRIFEWAIDVGRVYADADDPGAWLRFRMAVADRLVFSTVKEALGGEIDFLIGGGGSLPEELCRLYHGMGLPILEGYGLTETSPVISVNPPEQPKIGTMGPPVVDVDVRLDPSVVDQDDFDGDVGELLVRGPNVTGGYWNNPSATEAAFSADVPTAADGGGPAAGDDDAPWFRTGDIVTRDGDGYLSFLERRKELLVLSTGKNVAPTPIEDVMAASEFVDQCMVIGDNRKFVSALVVPNLNAIEGWADREGIDLPDDPAGICRDDRVRERVEQEIERANRDFEDHETIKRFRLVPEEFTEDNDLLTPTLKKKRRNILERYRGEIEAMYDVASDGERAPVDG